MSEWWNKGTEIPYFDPNFQKILDFFLFHCPSEIERRENGNKKYIKVSKRATTLREQGWIQGYLNTLLAAMKHTTSGHLEYSILKTDKNIDTETKRIKRNNTLSDVHFEMIVMTERTDMNKTSAILYYIRNAFAHGSFSTIVDNGRTVYYFESKKDNIVKAQIRLQEKTLLKWINDFSLSPKKLKQLLEEERKQKKKSRRVA